MFLLILAIALALVGLVAAAAAFFSRNVRFAAVIVAIIAFIGGGVSLFSATFYANGVGEAKVLVNSVDKTVVGTIEEPGSGFKAPWIDFVDFDLFSQELLYAGSGDSTPSYSGGSVSGAEVTVSVGGANGGSTQANVDISVTYSVDADAVEAIYEGYRSQERFTKQVIEKTILSTIRSVPSAYSATDFRGASRTEAADIITKQLNEKLQPLGVNVDFVNIQNVTYPDEVEAALKDVEVANQKQQKAQADLRAAETAAQQKVVEAQAESDANGILSASLTPQVLEQRRIDALLKAAESGSLIVDGGGGGILIQK
jgi:regulator of protease activity HflC (stomatin/prohibitin superfamily)